MEKGIVPLLPDRAARSLVFQERLGGGVHGGIFRALWSATGEQVAVKVADRDAEETRSEWAALTRLQPHPHIIQLRGRKIYHRDDIAFLVLELGDTDLLEYTRKAAAAAPPQDQPQGLPEMEARGLFLQLVKAVRHCHRRGVYHGDIKLENALLFMPKESASSSSSSSSGGEAGRAPGTVPPACGITLKLCDFGSASFARHTLSPRGSLLFAAPEVVPLFRLRRDGESCPVPPDELAALAAAHPTLFAAAAAAPQAYDAAAADVWSCGVVLLTMLLGRHPWKEASLYDLDFVSFLQGAWRVPAYLSPCAVSLLTGLLQVDPAKRFSMADVIRHPWVTPLLEGRGGMAALPGCAAATMALPLDSRGGGGAAPASRRLTHADSGSSVVSGGDGSSTWGGYAGDGASIASEALSAGLGSAASASRATRRSSHTARMHPHHYHHLHGHHHHHHHHAHHSHGAGLHHGADGGETSQPAQAPAPATACATAVGPDALHPDGELSAPPDADDAVMYRAWAASGGRFGGVRHSALDHEERVLRHAERRRAHQQGGWGSAATAASTPVSAVSASSISGGGARRLLGGTESSSSASSASPAPRSGAAGESAPPPAASSMARLTLTRTSGLDGGLPRSPALPLSKAPPLDKVKAGFALSKVSLRRIGTMVKRPSGEGAGGGSSSKAVASSRGGAKPPVAAQQPAASGLLGGGSSLFDDDDGLLGGGGGGLLGGSNAGGGLLGGGLLSGGGGFGDEDDGLGVLAADDGGDLHSSFLPSLDAAASTRRSLLSGSILGGMKRDRWDSGSGSRSRSGSLSRSDSDGSMSGDRASSDGDDESSYYLLHDGDASSVTSFGSASADWEEEGFFDSREGGPDDLLGGGLGGSSSGGSGSGDAPAEAARGGGRTLFDGEGLARHADDELLQGELSPYADNPPDDSTPPLGDASPPARPGLSAAAESSSRGVYTPLDRLSEPGSSDEEVDDGDDSDSGSSLESTHSLPVGIFKRHTGPSLSDKSPKPAAGSGGSAHGGEGSGGTPNTTATTAHAPGSSGWGSTSEDRSSATPVFTPFTTRGVAFGVPDRAGGRLLTRTATAPSASSLRAFRASVLDEEAQHDSSAAPAGACDDSKEVQPSVVPPPPVPVVIAPAPAPAPVSEASTPASSGRLPFKLAPIRGVLRRSEDDSPPDDAPQQQVPTQQPQQQLPAVSAAMAAAFGASGLPPLDLAALAAAAGYGSTGLGLPAGFPMANPYAFGLQGLGAAAAMTVPPPSALPSSAAAPATVPVSAPPPLSSGRPPLSLRIGQPPPQVTYSGAVVAQAEAAAVARSSDGGTSTASTATAPPASNGLSIGTSSGGGGSNGGSSGSAPLRLPSLRPRTMLDDIFDEGADSDEEGGGGGSTPQAWPPRF